VEWTDDPLLVHQLSQLVYGGERNGVCPHTTLFPSPLRFLLIHDACCWFRLAVKLRPQDIVRDFAGTAAHGEGQV
jgi:hypothetical protein